MNKKYIVTGKDKHGKPFFLSTDSGKDSHQKANDLWGQGYTQVQVSRTKKDD